MEIFKLLEWKWNGKYWKLKKWRTWKMQKVENVEDVENEIFLKWKMRFV